MSSFKHRFARQSRMVSTAPPPPTATAEDLTALAMRFNTRPLAKRTRGTGRVAGRVRA